MKTNSKISRRVFVGLLGAAVLAPVAFTPAVAHEANCPYCARPVTQDTPPQDNEVALKYGRKRIEYKCVYCALAEAKTEYAEGDLTITAPSEKKGEPVVIKRAGGNWSVAPATSHFVSPPKVKHKICQEQARAFKTKPAAEVYASKHGGSVLTLAELNATVK